MARIIDVSSEMLGSYMLQGWVLTDKPCNTPGCSVPLLRSPDGVHYICVNCPQPSTSAESLATSSSNSTLSKFSGTRTSTPPTELSSGRSSPAFDIPAETPESRRRREQSDRASAEIGNRLLRGYAMLGEECPNPDCFGIPLVRPPASGVEKDPRKECVVCGSVYVFERDRMGLERLVPTQSTALHEGKISQEKDKELSSTEKSSSLPRKALELPIEKPLEASGLTQLYSSLSTSSQALNNTLVHLSNRLTRQCGIDTVDPVLIGSLSEAIHKTTLALGEVQKLLSSAV